MQSCIGPTCEGVARSLRAPRMLVLPGNDHYPSGTELVHNQAKVRFRYLHVVDAICPIASAIALSRRRPGWRSPRAVCLNTHRAIAIWWSAHADGEAAHLIVCAAINHGLHSNTPPRPEDAQISKRVCRKCDDGDHNSATTALRLLFNRLRFSQDTLKSALGIFCLTERERCSWVATPRCSFRLAPGTAAFCFGVPHGETLEHGLSPWERTVERERRVGDTMRNLTLQVP
jgi:hypothetical protein